MRALEINDASEDIWAVGTDAALMGLVPGEAALPPDPPCPPDPEAAPALVAAGGLAVTAEPEAGVAT